EEAFAAIVARHGPLVLGVCRRLLVDPGDAEDAFQATFLVLVRRARSIGRREALGPWLFGVARRVALRSRARSPRRRDGDPPAPLASPPSPPPAPQAAPRAALDEEIARLPEASRRAVVLCLLEGRSYREAAESLRWTEAAVRGRLARARALLRD